MRIAFPEASPDTALGSLLLKLKLKKKKKKVELLLHPLPRFAALWERLVHPNKSLAVAVWLNEQSSGVEFRKIKPSFLLCHQSAGKTEHFPFDMCGNGNFQSRENFSYLKYSSELEKNKIKSEMWNFPQMENFIFGERKGEHSSPPTFRRRRGVPMSCPAPGTSEVPRLWLRMGSEAGALRNLLGSYR